MSDDHHIKYQEFMDEILQQLYANREKHKNSHGRGIGYMFCIVVEQVGQLGKALADKDWNKARVEVAHVAAVLYEVFERVITRCEKEESKD